METLLFKLEVYEGPLDLLLDMIKNSKVSIFDINISDILDQYLLYLKKMEEMNLNLTSEFMVMASYLLYIKSCALLPKDEPQEPEGKMALIDALVEYQKCKENAALLLKLRTSCGDIFSKPPVEMEIKKRYKESMPVSSLVKAYQALLQNNQRKQPPQVNSFVKIVGRERFSVGRKIRQVISWLKRVKILDFKALFLNAKSRSEAVATFLAVLEMAKSKKINIIDGENLNYKIEYRR